MHLPDRSQRLQTERSELKHIALLAILQHFVSKTRVITFGKMPTETHSTENQKAVLALNSRKGECSLKQSSRERPQIHSAGLQVAEEALTHLANHNLTAHQHHKAFCFITFYHKIKMPQLHFVATNEIEAILEVSLELSDRQNHFQQNREDPESLRNGPQERYTTTRWHARFLNCLLRKPGTCSATCSKVCKISSLHYFQYKLDPLSYWFNHTTTSR